MSQVLPTSPIPSLCSPFFLCVILTEFLSCHFVIALYSFMPQYLGILLFPRSESPPTFPQWPFDKLLFIPKTPMQSFLFCEISYSLVELSLFCISTVPCTNFLFSSYNIQFACLFCYALSSLMVSSSPLSP